MKNIEQTVLEILKRYTPNKDVWDNLSMDFDLTKDLKINSARIVDIVLDLEEEFNVTVNDQALQKINTISNIIAFLNEQLKNVGE